jgi:hypothetical protein
MTMPQFTLKTSLSVGMIRVVELEKRQLGTPRGLTLDF